MRCGCGEFSIDEEVKAWYGKHITEQVKMICKDCRRVLKGVEWN